MSSDQIQKVLETVEFRNCPEAHCANALWEIAKQLAHINEGNGIDTEVAPR